MDQKLTRIEVSAALRSSCYRLRSWMLLLLMILVFLSGLAVVYVKNAYRQNFIQYQQQKARRTKLRQQWNQLLLEDTTWGSYNRIEHVAQNELDMVVPPAQETRILQVPADVIGQTSAVGDNVSQLPPPLHLEAPRSVSGENAVTQDKAGPDVQ